MPTWFQVKVGIHNQFSIAIAVVIDALTDMAKTMKESTYANDFVSVGDDREGVKEGYIKWKKDIREQGGESIVNANKTKSIKIGPSQLIQVADDADNPCEIYVLIENE